ncbi:MAG: peptidoglycan recognition family protein [Candidatus Caldatribacteriota bacterium]
MQDLVNLLESPESLEDQLVLVEGRLCEQPQKRSVNDIKWIVLHHSGTPSGNVDIFRRYHQSLGWCDVGYHFVITNGNGGPDGEIQEGRPLDMVGAHCKPRNKDSVGIAFVGDFEKSVPTEKQMKALETLIVKLSDKGIKLPTERIIGHREAGVQTLCPGKNLDMNRIRDRFKKDWINHPEATAIKEMIDKGIMSELEPNHFFPSEFVKRSNLASAFSKFLAYLRKEGVLKD